MQGSAPTLGLRASVTFGIGAIVGGAAIVLAGPALVAAGPAVLLAVVLNGLLAALAALSLSELGARFPRSGGAYVFAQRVFSVNAAFAVGWLIWFASLAATAVFALGFAEFLVGGARALLPAAALGDPWWASRAMTVMLALLTIGVATLQLARGGLTGGTALTVAKVATFALLGGAGLAAAAVTPDVMGARFLSFAPHGALGVAQAMGLLFIAFQGFALVAAMAGEVREPARVLPRAMLTAIGVATVLYLALFFAMVAVGVPEGSTLQGFAERFGATAVAEAARTFLGPAGFWLVTVTALLAMITALDANLMTAARIARSMARDRTLPARLATLVGGAVPLRALAVSAGAAGLVVVALPTIAAAGAAAGLIYLVVFALAHVMAALARARSGRPSPFRAPAFALTATVGAVAATLLALLNAVSVPTAGALALAWLVVGGGIYLWFFARAAAAVDAEQEGAHPDLVTLRGRRPLVLVPIANPASAEALVTVAHALAPPDVGRVLLLCVVARDGALSALAAGVENAQRVLHDSLTSAAALGLDPEALITLADDPWTEIGRVARTHDCEVLLLGPSDLGDTATLARLDALIHRIRSDVVILRAPKGWHLEQVERVLVPFAGRDDQERLRARLLAATARLADPRTEFLRVLPPGTSDASLARIERALEATLEGRELGRTSARCVRSGDLIATVAERAGEHDLVVLGLPKRDRQGQVLGPKARELLSRLPASNAVVMIHRR